MSKFLQRVAEGMPAWLLVAQMPVFEPSGNQAKLNLSHNRLLHNDWEKKAEPEYALQISSPRFCRDIRVHQGHTRPPDFLEANKMKD